MNHLFKLEKDFTKSNLLSTSENILTGVNEGEISPLNAYVVGKALEFVAKDLIANTKELAIKEVYSDKKGTYKGAEYQIKSEATYYDYSADPVYASLEAQLKARKELLSTVAKLKQTVVDENGEVVPKVPVKSGGAETIAISFK
jgi:hypothetical protein